MNVAQLWADVTAIVEKAGGQWGVVIEHLETGERFEHNPGQSFYAASVIKLPILSAVFHEQANGTLSLEDTLTLRKDDQVDGSGVLKVFSPGTAIHILDLATLMIVVSDNTATNMLIDRIGVDAINAHMREDGLAMSVIHNKLQTVPVRFNGRNEITADDIALWLKKAATGALVSLWASTRMLEILERQQYHNKIPGNLPEADADEPIGAIPKWKFANKTGMVRDIEHDAGVLSLCGATFVIVTLAYKAPAAITAMQEIGRAVYDAWYGEGVS